MRTSLACRTGLPVLLLLLGSCAANPGPDGPTGLHARESQVEIANDGTSDLVVHLYLGGQRYRLGHVGRLQQKSFRIPGRPGQMSYSVRLVAEPYGSGQAFATTTLSWFPGQTLRAKVATARRVDSFDLWVQ